MRELGIAPADKTAFASSCVIVPHPVGNGLAQLFRGDFRMYIYVYCCIPTMNRGENREFSTAPMESGSFTVSSALSTPG